MIKKPLSPRVRFKLIHLNDLNDFFSMQSNPDVMRYIRAPDTDIKKVAERLRDNVRYAEDNPGLGLWMLQLRETDVFIGYVILRRVQYDPARELELGYALHPDFWRQGLATEVCQALLEYIQVQFPAQKVVAYIDGANRASAVVLKKCGFAFKGIHPEYAKNDWLYEWVAPSTK